MTRISQDDHHTAGAWVACTYSPTHPPAHDKGKMQDLVKGSSDKCPLKADHSRAAGGMHP